jgi:mannose-1-phosphate guanylyltransferase
MPTRSNIWALVLAAGDGKRLDRLTRVYGGPAIPKQYSSLRAGPSLLHDALRRALAVTAHQRTCVVVAEKHRCWWKPQSRLLPPGNVIVQPENLGTGVGILLPLLHILERDACARIVILPSDHHVRVEACLIRSLRAALETIRVHEGGTLLLGVTPEEPDPELGYIVPVAADDEVALPVLQFIEKPCTSDALKFIERGALWNTFIIAASIGGLLGLYERRVPELVTEMRGAVRRDRAEAGAGRAVTELYASLRPVDFSHDILPGQESSIRVVRVPPCGWSDLGTPERVGRTLAHMPTERMPTATWTRQLDAPVSPLSLAELHARQTNARLQPDRVNHRQ